jgi:AcrR family transcriptional regulator
MSPTPADPTADDGAAADDGASEAPLGGRFVRRLPSGRHGLPRAFVVRNQRERVLEAAARAVADKGYAATRVVDITDRAGVSRKTFYELFTDKEDCFLAAFDTVANLMFVQVSQAFEDGEGQRPWRERVRAGFEAFLEILAAEPAFARMCLVEVKYAGPHALRRLEASKRTFLGYLAAGRDEVAGAAGLPTLSEEVVVGGMYDAIERRVLAGEAEALPDMLDPFLDLIDHLYATAGTP